MASQTVRIVPPLHGSAVICHQASLIRVGSWQNGFFADFYFWAADFFADFVAGFFLLIFMRKKCPEKSSRKIPSKILPNLHNKNSRDISAEGPGQH